MSMRCRICTEEMPKDRHGRDQVCPKCRELGNKELWERPNMTKEKEVGGDGWEERFDNEHEKAFCSEHNKNNATCVECAFNRLNNSMIDKFKSFIKAELLRARIEEIDRMRKPIRERLSPEGLLDIIHTRRPDLNRQLKELEK